MEKELLIKMESEGRECLINIMGREPKRKELNDFMHKMFGYARGLDLEIYYVDKVKRELDYYLKSIQVPDGNFYASKSICLSFIENMSKEHRLMRYRYNLKEMLRREPTEEEFDQYLKNVQFLIHNEPGINEPDYRVVREAESRLASYLGDREDAFRKAKIRYGRLSVAERFKAGNLLAPRWDEMEEDMGINSEFLNDLYKGQGKQK